MTRSFARKLAPEVKVNSIAPSLILFNEHDDAEYRQQALNKSLMKTAPGEKEVIDLVDYLPAALSPDAVSLLMAVVICVNAALSSI